MLHVPKSNTNSTVGYLFAQMLWNHLELKIHIFEKEKKFSEGGQTKCFCQWEFYVAIHHLEFQASSREIQQ